MTPEIKQAIERGELVIFLGAGASASSRDRHGNALPMGNQLGLELASAAAMNYANEDLDVVYAAARSKMGDRLWPVLEDRLLHCKYSRCYETIARFPWARIYTTNVDDAFDRALRDHSPQHVSIRYRFDRVEDQDQLFQKLDLVKLNGSVDRRADGVVFSPSEYGQTAAQEPPWYAELGADYFRYMFLFIGTRLREPLFYHHVERYRNKTDAREGIAFVLTRTATEIEKVSFGSLKMQHIPGTLEDFCTWLDATFPKSLTSWTIAANARPELAALAAATQPDEVLRLLQPLEVVSQRDLAPVIAREETPKGKIRDFYRGFKPKWADIAASVPAGLRSLSALRDRVKSSKSDDRLFVLYGPAGSGKTTALMQLALELGDATTAPCYFLRYPVENLDEILEMLEKVNSQRYFLFIDKLSMVADRLAPYLRAKRLIKGVIVGTERQSVWVGRTAGQLGSFVASEVKTQQIVASEAEAILTRLKQFGNWTLLARLSKRKQIDALLAHADRQLLIGLLEATSGEGFVQIIEREYSQLSTIDEKLFVALVGLATVHRLPMPEQLANRALAHLGVRTPTETLLGKTQGIVNRRATGLIARHPVYIEQLFDGIVSKKDKIDVLVALLKAFSVYRSPILASVGRNVSTLFKLNVNHNFLINMLEGDTKSVLEIYEQFEKPFQSDGLYWLQYGLALRDAEAHDRALEVFRTARSAYAIDQTEHALAQQQLILAEMAGSKTRAYALLGEAKEILSRLDEEARSSNDYPIVTLSEHHTAIVRRFDGDTSARELARKYANMIGLRMKRSGGNPRLRAAWKKLATYGTSGRWPAKLDIYVPPN